MSVENFKQFSALVGSDAALREEVKAIGKTNVEGIMACAAGRGLPFTVEDLCEAGRQAGISKDELTEEQLESLAGGIVTTTAAAVGVVLMGALAGGALAGAAVGGVVAAVGTADDW